MDRRRSLRLLSIVCLSVSLGGLSGCRGKQFARVLDEDDKNMVGSHAAGSEVYEKQIDEAVGKMLGRESMGIRQVSHEGAGPLPKKICFVGVENASAEELDDFKQHIYELVDQRIGASGTFDTISQRAVSVGLEECRLRPDSLVKLSNQRIFREAMEQENLPFDYLLFARLTSGTTKNNGDYQRDYLLTLELLDIHSGKSVKESAKVRKGYHKTVLGRLKNS